MRKIRMALMVVSLGAAMSTACSAGEASGGGQCTPPREPGVGFAPGGGALDSERALRAAVMISSCVPDDRTDTVLWTLYEERSSGAWTLALEAAVDCLAGKATGCDAVEECLGVRTAHDGPCEPSCSGNVLRVCDDVFSWRIDCARQGLRCDAAEADCVPCTEEPACDYATFVPHCDGDQPVDCFNRRVTVGRDCAELGLACDESEGFVSCKGTGAACSGYGGGYLENGVGCQGDTLEVCIEGGLASVDCSSIGQGFSCQTVAGAIDSYFCGVAADCDPSPPDGSPADATCDGNALVVCNAGRIDRIDCKALGFSGCDAQIGVCESGAWR